MLLFELPLKFIVLICLETGHLCSLKFVPLTQIFLLAVMQQEAPCQLGSDVTDKSCQVVVLEPSWYWVLFEVFDCLSLLGEEPSHLDQEDISVQLDGIVHGLINIFMLAPCTVEGTPAGPFSRELTQRRSVDIEIGDLIDLLPTFTTGHSARYS